MKKYKQVYNLLQAVLSQASGNKFFFSSIHLKATYDAKSFNFRLAAFFSKHKKKIGTQVTHLAGCRTLADPKKMYTSLSK